mgnify:CR=1 FL=1
MTEARITEQKAVTPPRHETAPASQADDGTLIAATSVDIAKAALPATDDYRDLYLASSGAASFSIRRAALDHLAATKRGAQPSLPTRGDVEAILARTP